MSRKRKLSMRKVREVARLKEAGLSIRQISGSCQIARSTVGDYLGRLAVAGLSWPFPPDLSDEDIDRLLFVQPAEKPRTEKRPVPGWPHIHKELRRKAVTKHLLWQEYREEHPDGYGYSQFCEKYKRWAKTIDVCMRQSYRAGEKLFVDYAGMTMPVTDPGTGEVFYAEIFVATLGASNYIYAEATRSQKLHDWLSSHVRTFEHLGGVAEITVPDNLKETTDYYFFADNSSLAETPKIGIVLSPITEENTHKGLIIDQISPHGKAGEAGLMQGDLLIALNRHPIEDMADLRIAMLDTKEGDLIEAEVLRGKETKEHHTLIVELTIPKMSQMPIGHP